MQKTFQIKTKAGDFLYESAASDFKSCLEQAVAQEIVLRNADLSGQNLYCANLDGAFLARADFSGANLTGANLSESDFSGAVFTGARLYDACMAFSALDGCRFDHARFGGTDIAGATLCGTSFDGFSAFTLNFRDCTEMTDCRYQGCLFSVPPLWVQGADVRMAVLDHHLVRADRIVPVTSDFLAVIRMHGGQKQVFSKLAEDKNVVLS